MVNGRQGCHFDGGEGERYIRLAHDSRVGQRNIHRMQYNDRMSLISRRANKMCSLLVGMSLRMPDFGALSSAKGCGNNGVRVPWMRARRRVSSTRVREPVGKPADRVLWRHWFPHKIRHAYRTRTTHINMEQQATRVTTQDQDGTWVPAILIGLIPA